MADTTASITEVSMNQETEAAYQEASTRETQDDAGISESAEQAAEEIEVAAAAEAVIVSAAAGEATAAAGEATASTRAEVTADHSTTFNIYVGPAARRFSIDLDDLRRESALFRHSTSITSIELRWEDPAAVQLIVNWFQGNIGLPPVTKEAHDLFVKATGIAQQLQIRECENQLVVIVHKTAAALASLLYDQIENNLHLAADDVVEYVRLELDGYMVRSVNEGGRDDEAAT